MSKMKSHSKVSVQELSKRKRSTSRKKFEREDSSVIQKSMARVHNRQAVHSGIDLTDETHEIRGANFEEFAISSQHTIR
jgi:hypothetical protein